MAIKILTPPEKDWKKNRPKYIRTCPECKTKFEYTYEDCTESNWRGGYVAVLCPTCGYSVAHIVAGGGSDINHPQIEDQITE